MNHDAYPDQYIREILNGVKSIAMVGASPVNVRPSYFAFKYLAAARLRHDPGQSRCMSARACSAGPSSPRSPTSAVPST